MNNCDRCGKKIKTGTLCPVCNAYVEGYAKGTTNGRKVFGQELIGWLEATNHYKEAKLVKAFYGYINR